MKNIFKRSPDVIIPRPNNSIYLERWHLIPRNKILNVYLHCFHNSDPSDPHDHPWPSLSLTLKGTAKEHVFHPINQGFRVREYTLKPLSIRFRKSTTIHRILVSAAPKNRYWTLFLTGPNLRGWGFWRGTQFVPFEVYLEKYWRNVP